MSDVDRLVELITQRVKERLNGQPAVKLNVLPRDRGECNDDTAPGEDCADCGSCVVRRPWSVRAMEGAGAMRVGAAAGVGEVPADLGKLIDHTLLKPEATRDEVVKLCEEAKKYRFASVCVNTTWVPLCKSLLAGTDVMVCAVVGFPLGAMTPTAKAYEAREAVRQGAREIDMVINIGALRSRDYETVFEDICRVVKAAAPARVKVILETSALDTEQKIIACTLSKLAGAAFVKTSTGFGKGGATVEDVALMRRVVGPDVGVKASGGVRTAEDAIKMAQAGANRVGASASVAIVTGAAESQGKGD
ncbi:MAG TPA: deoxyribose-phosphate aldolase, partial [Kofleriaceae bacterium]|nr:deoxyribose-phosphate aldolase [Kofleriaceae bacterium]